MIFLVGIVAVVGYLSATHADTIANASSEPDAESSEKGGLVQTVIVLALVLVVGGVSYQLRRNALANEGGGITTADAASPAWTLGDLSSFKVITQEALDAVRVGDQSTANSRADDLEHEWDVAQARLKARDSTEWTSIDGKVDTVLRQIRASKPDPSGEQGALTQLLTALG